MEGEMRIAVIGEILWDVFDDGEKLGGAPFNFAAHAAQLVEEKELTFVHPFDDPDVIAGQGTVGMEIVRQCQEPLDALFGRTLGAHPQSETNRCAPPALAKDNFGSH